MLIFIMKMRLSASITQMKQSLFSFIKDSAQAQMSVQDFNMERKLFYRDFVRANKLKTCVIKQIQIFPGTTFTRAYAVYVIKVVTSDVHYEIKKRFTQFQNFYYNSDVDSQLHMGFPSKTYIFPGWTKGVTQKRKTLFNKLISQIVLSENNQELKFEFFDFIGLYEHYEEQGLMDVHLTSPSEPQPVITDEDLIEKVYVLGHQPFNALKILKQIHGALSDRKKKISYDVAKQILTGYGEEEGLISIVLTSSNPLIILEGLQLLIQFFSPETNRDHEIFNRVLSRIIPSRLVLSQFDPTDPESIFKASYFQLLHLYLENRQNCQLKQITRMYDHGDILEKQYHIWKRLRHMAGYY